MRILYLLTLLSSYLSTNVSTGNVAASNSTSLTLHGRRIRIDNSTIFDVSMRLCEGCTADSVQFLYAHNLVRTAKQELPLAWSSDVERYALWWAAQRKRDCELEHSFPRGDFKLGENIFWGGGASWTPNDAVNLWAGEEKYYDYTANSCAGGQMCGHYTQIVWKTTRRLGCARVACDDGDVFITCNYDPPGNYIGERPY